MTFDPYEIRKDFPCLERRTSTGRKLVYLDNAATSHKPQCVIEAMERFYYEYNANIHRGEHALGSKATRAYEDAREEISRFINANDHTEVIFTSGTTESINLVAYGWGLKNIKNGDEILLTIMEHHSNMLPWRRVAALKGAKIKYLDINEDGILRYDQLASLITEKTKVVAVAHVSNVLGTINDVRRLTREAHRVGAIVIVDGAQSVPHMPVSVRELDADFLAFSGHKMLGPTGIGVLWGRKELLEEMEPLKLGGGCVVDVTLEDVKYMEVPWRFEAGTPNIAGAIGLAEAVRYLKRLGMKSIRRHEYELTEYCLKRLNEDGHLDIYGPLDASLRGGVVAFNVKGISHSSVARALSRMGIIVRDGMHCAHPLHYRLGLKGSVRASFYAYNVKEEVDALCDALRVIVEVSESLRNVKDHEGECPTG